MRLFTETGAGPAPLSGACGALPEARNPVGERYTDVPARGCESTDAAAATATDADPASARRWAASSEVTSGVAGAWDGFRFSERGGMHAAKMCFAASLYGDTGCAVDVSPEA